MRVERRALNKKFLSFCSFRKVLIDLIMDLSQEGLILSLGNDKLIKDKL